MEKQITREKIIQWTLFGICIIYGFLLIYLFYNQTLYVEGGLFEADLPYHIKMAVEDHWYYSFTAYIYVFLYQFPIGNMLVAIFLSLVSVGSIFATVLLLREIDKQYKISLNGSQMLGLSMLLNVVMGFYIKWANTKHYIGYQSASIWHNSTYICMKLFAILVIVQFLRLMNKYKKGLSVKEWFVFTLLLLITTGIKPNFLMVFAPVMAIMLLIDLLKGTAFKRVFIFGASVLPSLGIILWQNVVLFGSDTGNGYAISPFYTLAMHSDNPKITLLLSVLFPGIVALFHIKDIWKDKLYIGSYMIWLFGFLEVFLFVETGNRAKDANFMWGYSISLFLVFVLSVIRLIRDYKDKNFLAGCKALRVSYLTAAWACFIWHVISGIWFFAILLTGATFFS